MQPPNETLPSFIDFIDALGTAVNPPSLNLIKSKCFLRNPVILDVGCGEGSLTCLLAKTINESIVIGVDIDSGQIDFARKRSLEENLTNISWEVCDIYKLQDLKKKYSELFDIVHSRSTLSQLNDLPTAVDQMLCMVKPGGLLIIEGGSSKKIIETPSIKPMEPLKKIINLIGPQFNPDTLEKVIEHLSQSHLVSSCNSEFYNLKFEGKFQKRFFRMCTEYQIKTEGIDLSAKGIDQSAILKEFGYDDTKSWLEDMCAFENDDSIVYKIENNENIIATKKGD